MKVNQFIHQLRGSKQIYSTSICLLLASLRLGGAHPGLANAEFADPSSFATQERQSLLDRTTRLLHAKEVLGAEYARTGALRSENDLEVRSFVHERTERFLRKAAAPFRKKSFAISSAILAESRKHGLDPIFLMAVIENESSFNPQARGPFGEIGLMQLRQATADWIMERTGSRIRSLEDPVENIKVGAAYLAFLRERFTGDSVWYVSAYNMGPANVWKLARDQKTPTEYRGRVMERYTRLYSELTRSKQLLSKEPARWLAHYDHLRSCERF
jgi:soluble lytic murein transglycosylase-like protein